MRNGNKGYRIMAQDYGFATGLDIIDDGSNRLLHGHKVFPPMIETSKTCDEFQHLEVAVSYASASNWM